MPTHTHSYPIRLSPKAMPLARPSLPRRRGHAMAELGVPPSATLLRHAIIAQAMPSPTHASACLRRPKAAPCVALAFRLILPRRHPGPCMAAACQRRDIVRALPLALCGRSVEHLSCMHEHTDAFCTPPHTPCYTRAPCTGSDWPHQIYCFTYTRTPPVSGWAGPATPWGQPARERESMRGR